MGLPVRIVVHTPDEHTARAAARAAFARIAALDRMMSDYRPDSELRRLEHQIGRDVRVSLELSAVLGRAVAIAAATDGAFDPTVGPLVTLWREARRTGHMPAAESLRAARERVGWRHLQVDEKNGTVRLAVPGMRLDLGGIAKGYILQEALATLRGHGVDSALLEAGGDLLVGNAPPGRTGWRIDAPGADPEFVARASSLTNAALATSGSTAQFTEMDGVRYSHIVDPRTGLAVTTPYTARVIAMDGATADATATALTVLGPQAAPALTARVPGIVIADTEGGEAGGRR